MKIRSFPIGLIVFVLLSANLTSCGNVPVSLTSTPPATQTSTLVIPSPTPTPTEAPEETQVPNPEFVQNVENVIGMPMIKSENGNYYIIWSDKDEVYKLFPQEENKPDQLTWSIGGEQVDFVNVGQDIVVKGVDANGNKVTWIQGLQATRDKETHEVSWELVAKTGDIPTGTVSENNPHFKYYSKNTDEFKTQENNVQLYLKAIEEKYPPSLLFPSDLKDFMAGSYEVANTNAAGGLDLQLFFPMSTSGQLLWGTHTSNTYDGPGKDRVIDPDMTGNYSPYQFAKQGAMYRETTEGWGMLYWPVYIMGSNGETTRIITVEDEVTASGKPINQIYAAFEPSDNMLPIQFSANSRNARRINEGNMFSPAMSVRMGNWYTQYVSRINFSQNISRDEIKIFKNYPFDNPFAITKLPDEIKDHLFLIFSGKSKINQ